MKRWVWLWLGVVALGLVSCESRQERLMKENVAVLARMEGERKRIEALFEEVKAEFGNVDEFTLKREEFLSFFSSCLHDLPEDAVFTLDYEDAESHYLSTMTIQNLGKVRIYDEEHSPKSLRLTTVLMEDHDLDIVLQLFDVPILEEEHADAKPTAEYPILRDVWRFEWKIMDGRTTEWDYEWKDRPHAPWRLELNTVFDKLDDECIYYFSFSPELEMRIR